MGTTHLSSGSSSEFIALPRFGVALSLIVALAIGLTFALWPKPVPLSRVRVHNASQHVLTDVTVGKGHYGVVRPGETTSYIEWGPAYRHEYVAFLVGGRRSALVPEDHFSEKPIGPGVYTYTIGINAPIESGSFTFEFSKDQ